MISTYETEEGTSDATATVNISLGNEPFDVLWSTGETTETITGLTAGLIMLLFQILKIVLQNLLLK